MTDRVAKKPDTTQAAELELLVDQSITPPVPLDPRIAAISLRAIGNYYVDGFDLAVSASFGAEKIVLSSDAFDVEVTMGLLKADIELQFLGCRHSTLEKEENESQAWKISEKETRGHSQKGGVSVELAGMIDANPSSSKSVALNGAISKQAETSSIKQIEASRIRAAWFPMGPNRVAIGDGSYLLEGQVISQFKGWRVIPIDPNSKSGVMGKISVREDWIKFERPRYDHKETSIGKRFASYLKTASDESKKLFLMLLEHLAHKGMQSSPARDAVIAADLIVLRPATDLATTVSTGGRKRVIELPCAEIEKFLECEGGCEAETLLALGVSQHKLSQTQPIKVRNSRARDFVPQSTHFNAIKAFSEVSTMQKAEAVEMQKRYEREIPDLISLGLIKRVGEYLIPTRSSGASAESVVRHAAYVQPSMQAVRAVLKANQHATSIQIADAVAYSLGKNWSNVETKKRNGNSLRRWLLWLEPHIIDPSSSAKNAAFAEHVLNRKTGRGAPKVITEANEIVVRRMLQEGASAREIGKRLGVSHTAVYQWMARNGLKMPRRRRPV